VGNDNCVSFLNRKLQIPASPLRAHFVKATVKVHQYPDGELAIFHGRRCLGRYDSSGVPIGEPHAAHQERNSVDPSAVSLAPCSWRSRTLRAAMRWPRKGRGHPA
jgi:hypothetical protein